MTIHKCEITHNLRTKNIVHVYTLSVFVILSSSSMPCIVSFTWGSWEEWGGKEGQTFHKGGPLPPLQPPLWWKAANKSVDRSLCGRRRCTVSHLPSSSPASHSTLLCIVCGCWRAIHHFSYYHQHQHQRHYPHPHRCCLATTMMMTDHFHLRRLHHIVYIFISRTPTVISDESLRVWGVNPLPLFQLGHTFFDTRKRTKL